MNGAAEATTPPGRDRYLDLLRAVALVRVVAYHTFAGAAFSLVFPSMGVMFALAGALMARSLRRPARKVLMDRARRLLLPLWVYSATVLTLLLWQGWAPGEDGSWGRTLLWFLPIADPPYPETLGSGTGPLDPTWAAQAGVILWYIRAYFWFMLLSPLLLRAFRARPWPVLLAPLALGVPLALGLVQLPARIESPVTDFLTFGSCWMLGFAHESGHLRRLSRRLVLTAGPVLMGLGLWWAAGHLGEGGWDLNDIPLAQALWSLGFCAMLLRISPVWQELPRPIRFLDGLVTLVNHRAVTIYLWHNLLLVGAVLVLDRLWDVGVLAATVPWVLGSSGTMFATVWVLLALVLLLVGWAEDIAARRPARLWPRSPAPAPPRKAAVPAPARGLWMYPRAFREEAARAFLAPGPAAPLETDGSPVP